MKWRLSLLAAVFSLTAALPAAHAQKKYDPGASDTEIKFGQTMPYSGPLSAYATLGKIHQAYFKKINDEGGVNGRKLTMLSLDDAYNPATTVEMTRRLVEQDNVLFIFGNLGTPTNTAIHRYLNSKKVPQLLVSTGGAKFADPQHYPWTIAIPPNYVSEGSVYGQHILKNFPNGKIGILYQNDDFGKDYVAGLKKGLGDKTNMIVSEVSYEATDASVNSQIVTLKNSGADVFFNVGSPKFAALAIRAAADAGWKPAQYVTYASSSIGSVLAPAGLDRAKGVMSVVFLKDPNDPQMKDDPAVVEYLTFLKKYYPEADVKDSMNQYGYTMAQTLVQVLKQAGDNLTRENIMKQAANLKDVQLPMMLPGIKINTSPTDYALIESFQMIKFDGKQWQKFGDIIGK